MALKVELKPGEKLILGESVITNGPHRTRLFIDGEAPILREKDILTPATADTPAKRIYLAVQLMYLTGNLLRFKDEYLELMGDFRRAAPSAQLYLEAVNNEILTGSLYKALKAAQALVAYEGELLSHAQRGSDLRQDGPDDGEPEGDGIPAPAPRGGETSGPA